MRTSDTTSMTAKPAVKPVTKAKPVTAKKPQAVKAPAPAKPPAPVKLTKAAIGHQNRMKVAAEARKVLANNVYEIPAHSNNGPKVHELQASTGAYGAPWCVSTAQAIDLVALGSTYADGTANVYAYEEYARVHGRLFEKPVIGAKACYHIGAGHMGTVVAVHSDGFTFDAVEGNEGDAVRLVTRDTRTMRMSFAIRPELAIA